MVNARAYDAHLMRTPVVWVGLIVVSVAAYVVWNTEWFHKSVFPEEFWAARVIEDKRMVLFTENATRSCQLDLEKLRRTRDIDLYQRRLDGMTDQEAAEDLRVELQATLLICKAMSDSYEHFAKSLERTRNELAKLKKR